MTNGTACSSTTIAAVTNDPGRQTPSPLAISAMTCAERVSLSRRGLIKTILPSTFSVIVRALIETGCPSLMAGRSAGLMAIDPDPVKVDDHKELGFQVVPS